MPSIDLLKTRWGMFIIMSALLVLTGCGGGNSQASIIGTWQLTEISFNSTERLPIPDGEFNVQVQFYKESVVGINTAINGSSVGGDGTYKFADEKNIQIEMPQGSQGLEALKTFIIEAYGRPVVAVVRAGTPTPTPPPPPPTFDTNFRSSIYEVQVSGDQLIMKGKDGVALTFKKIN